MEQNDKEQFRSYMRMYEKFTGCRVLTYCLMCNHVHLLVEVTPRPAGPMTDEEFIEKIHARYTKLWNGGGKRYGKIHEDYRAMLLIEGVEKFKEVSDERTGELRLKLERKGMSKVDVDAEMRRLEAGRGVVLCAWFLRTELTL